MSFASFYGKKASDLFKKNFTTDSKKSFGISTKTSNGVTYGAEGVLNGSKFNGKLSLKLKQDNGFAVKKLELSNTGKLDSEINLAKAVDNAVFKLVVSHGNVFSGAKGKKDKTELGVTYTHDQFVATLDVSPIDNIYAATSLNVTQGDFNVGATAKVDKSDDGVALSDYKLGLGYSFDNSVASVVVADKLNKVNLSFYRKHSSDLVLAAQVSANVGGDDTSVSTELGGQYTVDADTKITAKLTSPSNLLTNATASFNYSTKLSSSTSLDLTSVLKLDNNDADFFGSDFGLKLNFGA